MCCTVRAATPAGGAPIGYPTIGLAFVWLFAPALCAKHIQSYQKETRMPSPRIWPGTWASELLNEGDPLKTRNTPNPLQNSDKNAATNLFRVQTRISDRNSFTSPFAGLYPSPYFASLAGGTVDYWGTPVAPRRLGLSAQL